MEANTIDLLLFEDNPGDAFLFRQLIQDATLSRFSVTHVETLKAGLHQLRNGRFDLALVDLVLPDSDGLETFEQVKRSSDDIPIVVLTGMDDTLLALETMKRGAQDYLVKNMMTSELLERSLRYAIERKNLARLQEEVQRTRLELEAVREARRRFLSNISHELKTPLTSIVGNMQLLARSRELAINDREPVERALAGCGRLDTVITNILEASKIEADALVVNAVALNPTVLYQPLETRYGEMAAAKGISLAFGADLPPSITCDGAKLSFIIEALLDNAVKFTNHGAVEATLSIKGPSLCLSVADSGAGFPEGGHLFDAFHCDLHYLSIQGKGAGLGLPISKAYAEVLGGTLSVAPNEGGGSIVKVVIPVGDSPAMVDAAQLRNAAQCIDVPARAGLEDAVIKADPDLFRTRLEAVGLDDTTIVQFETLMQTYHYDEILAALAEQTPVHE